ncbi:hypothetical protein, partial [Roseinatronobacter thiooxidans]|uniref:hypothetical protein n=1 Tax=Roseinatronobacter thiooxidans TaxID=121821 RepID=UPI001C4342E6
HRISSVLVHSQDTLAERAFLRELPRINQPALRDPFDLGPAALPFPGVDFISQVLPGNPLDGLQEVIDPPFFPDPPVVQFGQVVPDMAEIPALPFPVHLTAFQIAREKLRKTQNDRRMIEARRGYRVVKTMLERHNQVSGVILVESDCPLTA